MEPFSIHIFCLKKEICALIIKKLTNEGYDVNCTNLTDENYNLYGNIKVSPDCIILDKDISYNIREKIQENFPGLPVICLPSLDTDITLNSGITYISEPLKLSELSEKIREIREKKEFESQH